MGVLWVIVTAISVTLMSVLAYLDIRSRGGGVL
jgi:hypothetical protein